MPNLQVTTRAGEVKTVAMQEGLSLMENLRDAGFEEIMALCGGGCACATCHVYVEPADALPPIQPDENDLLDSSSCRTGQSRLACQVAVQADMDGMKITIAPEE